MNSLVRNDETGFLDADNSVSFNSDKKVKFLTAARDYIDSFNEFPSIYALCKLVGISISTFENHCKRDEVFKQSWKEIISILKSVYVSSLATKASSKNGIVANLAILKYLETGTFVDRLQINSNDQYGTDKRVIDAVIIDSDPEVDGNASLSTTNIHNNSPKSGDNGSAPA